MNQMIVSVRDKMLRRIGGVNHFVTHNKDYEIQFQFDDSWADVRHKMAVFAYEDGEYGSEIFEGDVCSVPELPREGKIYVGVKAGDELSTELLCVQVCKSADDVITDEYDTPDPKIYEQILDIMNNLWGGGDTVYPSPVKFLAAPSAAKVGDLIRVKEVDENGDAEKTVGFDIDAALEKKIDAPQTAKVGEVLTVEEVDGEGVVKKVKTAEVQTDPPDWNENDPTKPGYIENRPFYSNENLLLSWTHDASNYSYVSDTDVKMVSGHTYIVSIDGEEYVAIAETQQTGRYDYSVCIGNYISDVLPFVIQVPCDGKDDADGFGKLTAFAVTADTGAEIKLYEADIHTIGEKYFPDTIFSQKNAPVKFGDGELSTIQGSRTTASGDNSHAEGNRTTASGDNSHAEGNRTTASGDNSHAEGSHTTASGDNSHAEGNYTTASGDNSHAEGWNTIASNMYQSVSGKFNKNNTDKYSYINISNGIFKAYKDETYAADSTYTFDGATGEFKLGNSNNIYSYNSIPNYKYVIRDSYMYYIKSLRLTSSNRVEYNAIQYWSVSTSTVTGKYIHIVGNGTPTKRSNAHTLDWDGNAWFAGDVYVGSTSGTDKDDGSVRLATEDDLAWCNRLNIIPTQGDDGTITYSSNMPVLFVYYEVFRQNPTQGGNSVECCLMPIEDNDLLTVLNYTGMSIDQNADGNTVLAVRFSSYVSGKHISAEIKDIVSGFQTDDEELLSTVVTVTESASLPTPTTAQVGQIVKVKSVDDTGKITETESAPYPVFYVTITKANNVNTADKTLAEIQAAYNSGCSVFAVVGNFILPLLTINDDGVAFCATTPDGEIHRMAVVITESNVTVASGSFVEGNQGVENAGKILGINTDGNVVPQDKPTFTLTEDEKAEIAEEVAADGVEVVEMDLPTVEQWELIKTIDVVEGAGESTDLTIDTDNNGNAFSLKKCRLFARFPVYTGETTIPNFSFGMLNGGMTGNAAPLCYTSGFPKLSTTGFTGTVWEVDVSGFKQYEKVLRSTTTWHEEADRYGASNDSPREYWGDKRVQSITSIGGAQMIIFPGCHFELYGVRT